MANHARVRCDTQRCALTSSFAQIDDITADGSAAVGLTWHVELGGVPFPFGRGASFVRVSARGGISYVRDIPEPSSKPGGFALTVLGLLAKLLRAVPGALPAAAKAAGAMPARGSVGDKSAAKRAQTPTPAPQPPPLPGCAALRCSALALPCAHALIISPLCPS